MKATTATLTEILSNAFEKCGYDPALGQVTVSDRMDLCQFQCNGALAGAKQYRKAPFIIAQEVVDCIQDVELFSKVEMVKPGFINLTLSDAYLLQLANEMWQDDNAGVPQATSPETIVIDYGGPNVAKPLHIGHLRAAIIGEALKRLARACGNTVYGDVHLGDWGLQMGLVISELEERNPDWKCFSPEFDPAVDAVPPLNVELLKEVYPFASKKSKENSEFMEKAHTATVEFQKHRPGYYALGREIVRVSVADLKKSYEKLNVDFDLWYGESDAAVYVEPLLAVLTEKGLLHESDGAMVVDVEEETDKAPVPPVLIKKSDGSSIYATTDLAAIMQRQKDFQPEEIWYVVDNRQSLHFMQVFRCAKKAGLVPEETKLLHLGFGTMNGNDGKPYKTRDGGVMELSALLNTVISAAYEKLTPENYETDAQRWETAEKVGVAAIKFGDLINHRSRDYVFDLDKFLSFEGKTGVYLLYTVTRINSILRKAGVPLDAPVELKETYTDVERELLLSFVLSGEAYANAIKDKAPNLICEDAYQIATAFSKFYYYNHILAETDEAKKQEWIGLCLLTRKLLLKHLDILGIEAVESM